ncbi:MAG: hypothetical protein HYW91_03350 [Candidatus Sungbacteria bacterium]|nr:hypothetical protein [Candidatus Sungbacteria bacterium]
MKIVKDTISLHELRALSKELFGDYVKAVVDVAQGIAAFGGELHADEEAELLKQGLKQRDLWGLNLYPEKSRDEWIEFDSMINVRPSQDNRSRVVESEEVRQKIRKIINEMVSE